MILNNFRVMQRVGDLRAEELTPELICEIQRIVTDGTLDSPATSGRFQLPGEDRVGIYWWDDQLLHQPPPAADLPDRMERLCAFANGETDSAYVPPVIRAMVLHFMIGYEHPFEDGNGRAARALFYWSMLRHGFWLVEFLSISRILKGAPSKYAMSFIYSEQDENDLTHFISYQMAVLQRAITDLHSYLARKGREVRELQRSLALVPGEFNHRQLALLEHAVKHPDDTYTVRSHASSHNVVTQTARADLESLAARGILTRRRVGRAFEWAPVDDLADVLRERSSGP